MDDKLIKDIDSKINDVLVKIQNDLFIVGSDLANPDMSNTKIRTTQKMVDEVRVPSGKTVLAKSH